MKTKPKLTLAEVDGTHSARLARMGQHLAAEACYRGRRNADGRIADCDYARAFIAAYHEAEKEGA